MGSYPVKPGCGVSVGTWGNKSDGLGIYYNIESCINTSYNVSLTINISASDLDNINRYLTDDYNEYAFPLNVCSTYAGKVWNAIAPSSLKLLNASTPNILNYEIMLHSYDYNRPMKSVGLSQVFRFVSSSSMIHVTWFSYNPPVLIAPLSGSTSQSRSVNFSWNSTGASKYSLVLDSDQGKELKPNITTNSITYTLPDAGTWTWKVASYTDDRLGDYSDPQSFTITDETASNGAPTLYTPTNNSSYQAGDAVTFQWSDVGAPFYRLYLYNDTTGESPSFLTTETSKSYQVPTVGSWRWKVASLQTSIAVLATSSEASFTVTVATTPPSGTYSIPTLSCPDDGTSYNAGSSVTFQWSNTGGI